MDIRLLLMDVDGVLTDGGLILDDNGVQYKRFNVVDGFAIRLWMKMGLHVGIVTGRTSGVVSRRAAELGIPDAHVIQHSKDKVVDAKAIAAHVGVTLEQTAFVGDDWPDFGVMRAVGYPIAPSNARVEIAAIAKHLTAAAGGYGAVREAVEHLLTQMGRMDEARALYDPGQ